ncbi:lipase family protein [Alkalihalobacterium alkalinitrilicum]|uniref:lipase family protein n=1 Tax=Alkalihalobacterium alkalinitrilicum TaxID=427920 RepID=UPI0009955A46|nr:lipase family protein [Alkalihalobacterium alkalinitrilicum]
MNLERNLILLAAVSYQANMRIHRRGKYTTPHGFHEVSSLASDEYPLAGFIIESPHEIIVAFRGTEEPIDVIADLDWIRVPYPFVDKAGMTERGFTRNYQSIRKDVIKTLRNLSSDKRLYITGHSLGGAIATLAALDIASNTPFTQPLVYTYASPRVGNPEFVKAYNQVIDHSIRVVNTNDIVPHFPPTTIPLLNISYRHVDKRFPIHFQTFSIRRNHEIEFYFKRLCNMFKTVCIDVCHKNKKLCPPSKDGIFLEFD